ncbi:MAG TPA: nucleoside phosphorylase [Silvibacterium sp.]|jgi:adenosylhomocysteine nucleosidase|nr:nucleoside phosphorylase [Silvibacterium sp.]
MSRIAIIAALPGELKPLIHGWRRTEPNVWSGVIAGHEAIAIAGGMGSAAAGRAVTQALDHDRPDALISYGWCGAITCAVKPPMAFAISEVIDHSTGDSFRTASTEGLRLVTLDHVAGPNEKRPLAEKHQAVLVDMEAATVARLAVENNLAFYCFKAISDAYTDNLPDFNRFISPAGQLRTSAFMTYAVIHPGYWAALIRLGTNSGVAASNLARLLSKFQLQSL